MMLTRGQLVQATAGGEKGEWFAVLYEKDGYAYLINGKRHRADNPKKKNIKHISATKTILGESELTDNKLRKALNRIKSEPAVTN